MDSDRVVVTLVHGTWGRNSEWVKEDSKFVEELNSLPGEVEIRTFQWTGDNRFAARRAAADELRHFLNERKGKRQYVIAHSHGGNVAVRAALQCQELINGLVCLSTPFLSLLRRDPDFILGSCFAPLAMGSLVAGLGLMLLYFTDASDLLGVDSLLLGVALLVSVAVCGSVYSVGPQRLKALQDADTEELPGGERTLSFPVLCVNRAEDEALTALSLVDNLTGLPSILISRITSPMLWVVFLLLTALGVIPSLAGLEEVSQTIAHSGETVSWLARTLFVGGSSLIYLGLLAIAAVALTLAFSFFATGLAFGDWTRPLGNLYGRLVVTLTPLPARRAEFVEAPLQTEGGGQGLLHQVYDDLRVQRKVQGWIADQIRLSTSGGA